MVIDLWNAALLEAWLIWYGSDLVRYPLIYGFGVMVLGFWPKVIGVWDEQHSSLCELEIQLCNLKDIVVGKCHGLSSDWNSHEKAWGKGHGKHDIPKMWCLERAITKHKRETLRASWFGVFSFFSFLTGGGWGIPMFFPLPLPPFPIPLAPFFPDPFLGTATLEFPAPPLPSPSSPPGPNPVSWTRLVVCLYVSVVTSESSHQT